MLHGPLIVWLSTPPHDRGGSLPLGSWPEWLSAVATGLAFIIAAITYALSVRDRSRAQARLVYASIPDVQHYGTGEEMPMLHDGAHLGYGEGYVLGPGADGTMHTVATNPVIRCLISIHNGSDELIGPVRVQLYNVGLKKLFDRVRLVVGPVQPRSEFLVDFTVINEQAPGQPSISPVIIFRDSSGRWWKRHQYEPIERIHDDPANLAETPTEREQRAVRVRAWFGKELEPEPKVTPRVRLHRLWRRLQGKTPTP